MPLQPRARKVAYSISVISAGACRPPSPPRFNRPVKVWPPAQAVLLIYLHGAPAARRAGLDTAEQQQSPSARRGEEAGAPVRMRSGLVARCDFPCRIRRREAGRVERSFALLLVQLRQLPSRSFTRHGPRRCCCPGAGRHRCVALPAPGPERVDLPMWSAHSRSRSQIPQPALLRRARCAASSARACQTLRHRPSKVCSTLPRVSSLETRQATATTGSTRCRRVHIARHWPMRCKLISSPRRRAGMLEPERRGGGRHLRMRQRRPRAAQRLRTFVRCRRHLKRTEYAVTPPVTSRRPHRIDPLLHPSAGFTSFCTETLPTLDLDNNSTLSSVASSVAASATSALESLTSSASSAASSASSAGSAQASASGSSGAARTVVAGGLAGVVALAAVLAV